MLRVDAHGDMSNARPMRAQKLTCCDVLRRGQAAHGRYVRACLGIARTCASRLEHVGGTAHRDVSCLRTHVPISRPCDPPRSPSRPMTAPRPAGRRGKRRCTPPRSSGGRDLRRSAAVAHRVNHRRNAHRHRRIGSAQDSAAPRVLSGSAAAAVRDVSAGRALDRSSDPC